MSKFAKIWIAVGGTIVFLLVTLSLLVKVVVTPEKVRENLIPFAEKALQRKIDIGLIDIGIFSGVSLSDLSVQKKQVPGVFISVKTLSLHYKLLALLTGDLVIDKILLESPNIEVERSADGKFNFSDLLSSESTTATDVNSENNSFSGSSAFDLLISKVLVTDGELHFIDRLHSSKSPYRFDFHQFNFQASQITLEKAFPIDLSAEMDGSKINISGRFDLSQKSGDLDLQLSSLDLVKFAPYYRKSLPGNLGSASLTLNLEAQLKPQAIESKGKLTLENLDLTLNDLPDAALEQAKLGIDYSLKYDLQTQKLDISTLLVDFNDIVIGAEGGVDLAGSDPNLSLSLLFDQLDLRTLFKGLPRGLTNDLQSYSLAGKLKGRVSLAGKLSQGLKFLKNAEIDLIDVNASVDNLRTGISGNIHYANQQAVAEKLVLSLADQEVLIDFKVSHLLSDIIRGEFNISATQLDLNRLLPEAAASAQNSSQEAAGAKSQTVAEDIGPFNLPIDMTGKLRVGKLIYKKLDLNQVQADLALKNNHLRIEQLRSAVAGGEFVANSDIDLGVKGLKYQGQMKLDQSNLLTLVSGLVPQADQSVSGLLRWQNNFSGRGTIPNNLLQSLQVKGLMNLQKGEISGSPLLEQIAIFLGIPDLKILSFDNFESRYDLRDGLANLSGQLDSSKAKFKPEGTVGVDGALDMKLGARIAPELMQKLGVKTGLKQSVSDQDGWGILPLVVRGNLSEPKISFDVDALQQQATSKAKEEAKKKLLDELVPTGKKEHVPVKQLLEGTLNRLFDK